MTAVITSPSQTPPSPERIARRRRWAGWLLVLLTFAIGLATTFGAWYVGRSAQRGAARLQFEYAANNIVSEVNDALDAHVQILWGAAALLQLSPTLTSAQWQSYTSALDLPQRVAGAIGIGYVLKVPAGERAAVMERMRAQNIPEFRIWPVGDWAESNVVTLAASATGIPTTASGFDLSSDPDRVAALQRARDSGQATVSSRITLLIDRQRGEDPGFSIYLPVYRQGFPISSVEERRAAILGYLYSPVRAREFLTSRLIFQQIKQSDAEIEVYDGPRADEASLLYRSPDFTARMQRREPVTTAFAEVVGGRTWTFRVASWNPAFLSTDEQLPTVILAAGLLISVFASAMVGTLAINRAQAVATSERLRADMIRRDQMQREIAQSEARLRDLFDNIPIPTVAIDRDTMRYLEVNKAAIAKYGYTREDFARMTIADVRSPDDVPEMMRYMRRVRTLERYTGAFRHILRDGTAMDVEVQAHNMALNGREVTIVTLLDVTERRRAAAALAASEQQLRQAQKLEALGQLTGGIAHDFNNILTVITGTIDILAEGVAEDPKLSAITRLIRDAATRGADTTRGLLAFARRQPLQPVEVDIKALVASAAKLFRATLGQQIQIDVRPADDVWPAFVDASQLTTALLNLALNARDAMPDGGKLLVEAANVTFDTAQGQGHGDVPPGDYVMIAVSDTGDGIPAAIRDKIFEPFFTTKDIGKGTGLGLSMVYGFAKQSGGHVKVYTEEGCGTTIRLYLPRAHSEPAAPTVEQPMPLARGTETVLVVEDDALVGKFVTAQLKDLGYETLVASNGVHALEIVDSGVPFDLLFTDIVMPGGMNGRQLAREVRKRRPGMRILCTSGYTEAAAAWSGWLEQGIGLLDKPYRKVDLARKVRDALDAPLPVGEPTDLV